MVLPIEKGVTDIPPVNSLARSQTVQKLGFLALQAEPQIGFRVRLIALLPLHARS